MTFVQTYSYLDYLYGGQVVVVFKVSDAYDDLFLPYYPEGDGLPTDVFMLESTKQDLNIDDGKFAVDELPFSIRETACEPDNDINAMYFCLDAADVHNIRYCALFFQGETVFVGMLDSKISGDDIYWESDDYDPEANPIREYKFTAYSADISLLEKASLKSKILDKENNVIPHIYDRIAGYPSGYTIEAWNNATSYEEGVVASYNGKYWKARQANTDKEPPNTEYWIDCGDKLAEDIFDFGQTFRLRDCINVQNPATEITTFYYFPLGNLYAVLNWLLEKANDVIQQLTDTIFQISFGECDLFIKTNAVSYIFSAKATIDSLPITAGLTRLWSSPEQISLSITDAAWTEGKSPVFIHRRMIEPEWGQGIFPVSDVKPSEAASSENAYSFKNSDTISELLFELARNFGCYIAVDFVDGRNIIITFKSRKAIIEDSLTYIVGTNDAGFDASSVFESEANQYHAHANNFATDGFDIAATKWGTTDLEESANFKAKQEEIKKLEKKFNIKSEKLLLTTSALTYEINNISNNRRETRYFPFNIHDKYLATPNSEVNKSNSYYAERVMYERIHTGIYVLTPPREEAQITLFGSELLYRPAINIYASDNGEDLKFETLTEYVNYCLAKDKQYYETEYSITVPSWCAFSKSADGSNPSWKNLKLGSKIRLTQSVKHYIDGAWQEGTDTRDYAVVGIERNLQKPETKIKLQDVSRFAFGYPSGTAAYPVKSVTCVNKSIPIDDTSATKGYVVADGDTIPKGAAVMLLEDGTISRAMANGDYYGKIIGVALEQGAAGEYIVVQSSGKVTLDVYNFSNENQQIFVRENASTADNISESVLTEPSGNEDMIILLGKALDAHTLELNIEEFIFEGVGGV